MIAGVISFFRSYLRAQKMGRQFGSREALEAWQERKVQSWLRRSARKVDAYKTVSCFEDLPVIQKSDLMDQFQDFNRAEMSAAQGFEAFEGEGRFGRYHVGASTGTSGNRGIYLISNKERFAWLGAILGKVLPDFWKKKRRVAVVLPLNSSLYDTAGAGSGGRVNLMFLDLTKGPGAWAEQVFWFEPDVIVAPPRVLRWIAEWNGKRLSPERVISGAEVLDPVDREVIEKNLAPVEEIYMATEGLLATTCSHRRLHLCEDFVRFELEPVDGGLVSPVITDFSRTSQIMARYRMNDLLRIEDTPCPCGSPFHVVAEVVGRQDDVFLFAGGIQVTPDVLRNAILDSDRGIKDFRLFQNSEKEVELVLEAGMPEGTWSVAKQSLEDVLSGFGVSAEVKASPGSLRFDAARKLRRVERRFDA